MTALWPFIVFFGLMLVAETYTYFFFTKTSKTCATIYKIGTSRWIDYFHYTYVIEGKKYDGSIEVGEIKNISLDSLKKIECIKIEYSNYVNSFSRVIDQSILK